MSFQKILTSAFVSNFAKEKQLFAAIAIGILSGSIALLHVNRAVGFYSIKAVQLIVFIALGNRYNSTRQSALQPHPEKFISQVLLIAVTLCVLLNVFYLFLRKDVWLMAFGSSAAFVLPVFLKLCWRLFTSIPRKEFNTWFPHNRKVTQRAPVFLNSFLVRLKLKQHVTDVDEKIYTVFIPQYNSLGDFFSRFLTEHNVYAASFIEDNDGNENKYAWEFFTTAFFGLQLRRLDPLLSMQENKIKKDALVYVKRLMQPNKLPSHKKNILNETIK